MNRRNVILIALAVLFLAYPLYSVPDKPPQEVQVTNFPAGFAILDLGQHNVSVNAVTILDPINVTGFGRGVLEVELISSNVDGLPDFNVRPNWRVVGSSFTGNVSSTDIGPLRTPSVSLNSPIGLGEGALMGPWMQLELSIGGANVTAGDAAVHVALYLR